jgi:putative membrane protein
MKRSGLLSIALATALTVACNSSGRSENRAASGTNTIGTESNAERNSGVSAGDKRFIQDMLADGDAEIAAGKYAVEHARSRQVKRFAEMMVADHTKAADQLKQIAATYAIEPDPDKANVKQDLMDRLSKQKGADFDREYMKAMIDKHQDAVDDLEKHVDVATSGTTITDKVKGTFGAGKDAAERNGQVTPEKADNHVEASANSWAADTLPVVRKHLDEAKQIEDGLQHSRRNTTSRR